MTITPKIIGFSYILSVSLLLTECGRQNDSGQVQTCLEFLYANMSPDDDLLHTRHFWEDNVAKTLEVKDKMGWIIPDREFMHFVLPLRVGTERIDDFRTLYADTLCRRVAGMDMTDAALEMNHWLREQARYLDTKPGTDSPVGTVQLGYGDCNALSGLLVSALRAIGIPARQVSAAWPFTHGTHSWVECWVDGIWQIMDAGDPSHKFGLGMIVTNGHRVMLAPISVFGDYNGPETLLGKTNYSTSISNLKRYAPVKNLKVRILDSEGNLAIGAEVKFLVGPKDDKKIFYASNTNPDAIVELETGYGDCAVIAQRNGLWGISKINAPDSTGTVVLQMDIDKTLSILTDMCLVSPPQGYVSDALEDQDTGWLETFLQWAVEDSIRASKHPDTK